MACEQCRASYLHMFSIDNAITRALPNTLSSRRENNRWKKIFLTTGDDHGIWLCHIRSFLQYPQSVHRGRKSCDVCSEYGIDSAVACRWRCLVLYPLLNDTAMDFWNPETVPRVQRDWYCGTIEMILLYLQGTKPTVVRPLPAIKRMVKHANLYVHPLLYVNCRSRTQLVCAGVPCV